MSEIPPGDTAASAAREEALFKAAVQHGPGPARSSYLDKACAGDRPLRERLEALIQAHESSTPLLEPIDPGALPETIRMLSQESPGTRIGRYKLLQVIGEGGMGVVHMAEQEEPVRRRVALKIIKLGMDTRQVIARFEAERQALALMDHPNIAQVLDGGATESGRPYFVMELVQGVPITAFCDKNKLSARERLRLFIQVCHAIQSAHQKGIVHRDIKPSNVLVTLHHGEAMPKVIDFGIAKATNQKLTEKTLFTNYATMIGTPAYMSPEQAEMSSLDVDTRSDVYALGVLLYELLTGTTPFPDKRLRSLAYGEMQRVIMEEEPDRPSTRLSTLNQEERGIVSKNRGAEMAVLSRLLRGDLDWIVMKCLEKDRTRRYETANSLALDIQRHLGNEPVAARPPSTSYRLQKALRRHRGVFVAGTIILAVLLAGVAISAWQAAVARREAARATLAEQAVAKEARLAKVERDRALVAQAEADRNSREARRHSYVANVNLAAHALLEGNLARVRTLLQSQVPAPGQEDLRDFEWRYLWQQSRSQAVSTLQLHRIPIWNAFLTPDNTKLITAQLYDQVRVFEPVAFQPIAVLSTNVLNAALSRDGRSLAVLRTDSQLQIFDVGTLRERLVITNVPATADKVLISADASAVALADASRITFWDAQNGRPTESIDIRPRLEAIGAFAASPDWSSFLTSDNESIYLWDRATRSLAAELPGHKGNAFSATFSPDGRWFATGGWTFDHTIRLWDRKSKQLVCTWTNHQGWIGQMDFAPDGTTLASCGSDHTIRLWDLQTLSQKSILRGHADEVWLVQFSADGRLLVSGARGGEVSLWNASAPGPERAFLPGEYVAGTFSANAQSFISATRNGIVQSWDVATLREIRRASVVAENATSARLSPGGSVLAIGLTNGVIHLHDLAASGPMPTLNHGSDEPVRDLEFSANGKRLASSTALDLRVWDMPTGAFVYAVTNVANEFWKLNPMALSPDASTVAFGSIDLELRLVELSTGALRQIAPDLWGVIALAFSPDGQYLAAAGRDHRIKIWRLSDFQEILVLKSWRQQAQSIAFSSSSQRLAVTADEGSVRLIDLATTQEVASLPAKGGPRWVLFSPDDNCLVAHFGNGFHFWRAPSWEQIASARSRVSGGVPSR